jgi:hypothetical protein
MVGGDANEPGDAGGSPGKSSLFFLTASCPGIGSAGGRATRQAKHPKSWGVRRAPDGP